MGYRLFRERTGEELPDRVSRAIQGKDIYELPLALHIELIAASWTSFVQQAAAQKEDEAIIYLFECCFIQNPVTMGMIRCGAAPETTIGYVKRLEEIVQALNPLIVYADQRDLDYSFRKAKAERPAEWSEGFMEYYLQQGYGAAHVCLTEENLPSEAALEQAVAGTVEILRARRKLEKEILGRLELPVIFIDNSDYDEAARARVLRRELVPFQLLIRGLRFPETHTL
ncbi:hypothetical protein [Saccharibacillus qingshengii]|uniref:hypothetical protein n=1 Tax=Saccharibacillus qingshengii TaxID=1763540 RepID=UPI001554FA0C|nr:hypothetical protein [Saccharibacillus qingshengii]